MTVLPTPNGAPTLPDEATGSSYSESYFQALFTQQWGSAAGNAYAAYNKRHPQNSAYINAQQFLDLVVAQGLDNAIKNAVSMSGTALGAIPGAAAQGAANAANALNPANALAAIGKFFGGVESRNFWLRTAKFMAGMALIVIGVIRLTNAQSLAKTAVKGALL